MPDSDDQNDADNAPDETGIVGDLRRWRRVDDLDGLRMRVQRAMRTAETVMYADNVDPDTR